MRGQAQLRNEGDPDARCDVLLDDVPPVDFGDDVEIDSFHPQKRFYGLPDEVHARVSDDGVGDNVRDGHRSTPDQRVVLGSDEHRPGHQDRMKAEPGSRTVHRRDREIDLEFAKPAQPFPAAADSYFYARTGKLPPKALEEWGQQVSAGEVPGSDAKTVCEDAMVLLGKGVGETVHAVHEREGEMVEPLADVCQEQTPAAAIEQRQPELLFQRTHLEGHRRLAQPKPLCRAGDAAEASGPTERTKLLEPVPFRVALRSSLVTAGRTPPAPACHVAGCARAPTPFSLPSDPAGVLAHSRPSGIT